MRAVLYIGLLIGITFLSVSGCDNVLPGSTEQSLSEDSSQSVVPDSPNIESSEVVAKVNGSSISLTDMELRIQELKALVANRGQEWIELNQEQLEAVLEELISSSIMSDAAIDEGLHDQLGTQKRWEYVRRGFFSSEWIRANRDTLTVSPDEIALYYEQNKPVFNDPERRRFRRLIMADVTQAKTALARLLDGSIQFEDIARQSSLGPEAADGGLLKGWVMRNDELALLFETLEQAASAGMMSLEPSVEAAAFAIDQVGSFSTYVKGEDERYHLFQLVERVDARERPLDEVKEAISTFLLAQKMQSKLNDLNNNADVSRFPDLLSSVEQ